MGRRKKIVDPVEEVIEGDESSESHAPVKDFHWSDDGPRYNVMVEFDDSCDGYRHYGSFFETEDLELAKHECLARFEDQNKTTLIHDRAERNKEIVRHEAVKTDGSTPTPVVDKRKKSPPQDKEVKTVTRKL